MALPGKSPTDAEIAEAERRKSVGLPPWTWQQYCRRKRHVRFIEQFVYEWLRTKDMPTAAMRAARIVFNKGRLSDMAAKKKGWDMLKRPDVCVAVEKAFEEHGFSFADMVDLHIKHIKGEFVVKRAVKVKDGKDRERIEIVEECPAPNYAALRDFESLVIHKAPQKFQIENLNKDKHVGGVLGGSDVPEIATDEYPKLTAHVERPAPEAEDAQFED